MTRAQKSVQQRWPKVWRERTTLAMNIPKDVAAPCMHLLLATAATAHDIAVDRGTIHALSNRHLSIDREPSLACRVQEGVVCICNIL